MPNKKASVELSMTKEYTIFNDELFLSRKCHNLGGLECQGANASDCIARINELPCPTYSSEELEIMLKGGDLMSKKTSKKKKITTKALLPKIKPEPTEKIVEEAPAEKVETMTPQYSTYDLAEKILLEAPMLPWEIDKAYIDIEFRKGYVALLKNLVKVYGLPYNVNQVAKLTEKER